jgi:RNA polymerase sigma factor (TIGR02999 family)
MTAMKQADPCSSADLLPVIYDELRRMAAAQLGRKSARHTLQPTALVHEAWLRLGGTDQPQWQNRAHFFSAAAETMRNILIDRARRRHALRHGGGQLRLDVDDVDVISEADDEHLLAINDAVDKLSHEHPRLAELVKLRCFVGLDLQEAALALDISRSTATRWWLYARTWLYQELHC